MNKSNFKEKLQILEAEVILLKTALVKKPAFDIDEANWQKIKTVSKGIRNKLFKKLYA